MTKRSARPEEATWPLVGRDDEIAVVLGALRGRSAGVALGGDLGVGKTRLAAELTDRLTALDWQVSRHAATEARAGVPFAALASLLPASVTDGPLLSAFAGATEQLRGLGRSILISVDDAHWLDETSTALLHHLVEAGVAKVLLTVRSSHERAGRAIELARSLGLERVQLQPLSQREVATLLGEALPDVDGSIVRRLWTMTSGNPLFLHEVVSLALESRALVRGAEGWLLGELRTGALPDVVDARLDELDPGARHVLELVTIAGSASVSLLTDLVDTDAVVEVERRGLVVTTESGRRLVAGLAHPLYGELVSSRLGLVGRRARRDELLGAIAGHGRRRRDDLVLTAVWQLEQGDHADPGLLLEVAGELSGLFPSGVEGAEHTLPELRRDLLGTAARLAQAALRGGGGVAAARTWFQIEAARDGRSDATMAALQAYRNEARTPDEETRVLLAMATLQIQNGAKGAEALIDELLDLSDRATSGEAQRSVDAILALTFGLFERYEECLAAAERALRDPATSPGDRLIAAGPYAGALALLGRSTEALEAVDEAMAALPADADAWAVGALVYVRIAALACHGRLLEAEELAGQCVLLAEATGNVPGVYLFSVISAQLSSTRGRPDDMIASARSILVSLRHREGEDAVKEARPAHAFLAHAYALQGRLKEARAELAVAQATPARTRLLDAQDVRSEAWVRIADGHRSAAVGILEGAARAGVMGVPGAMTCLHDLVLLGERGVGDRMRAVGDPADSPLWTACVAHADALDAGDGAALDRVVEDFAGLGATLWAAEAAAHAAAAHAAAGKGTAAARSSARSTALADECQGAVTPALQSLGATVPKLTRRELEVARLAADGRTDQEIADLLFVSVRTVESHLYNSYSKLGISTRAELAALPDL